MEISKFSPEQPKQTIPEKELPPVHEREKTFDLKGALAQEKTLLEKLHGRAREIAKVLILASMFVVGEGLSSAVRAQEKPPTPVIQKEREINLLPLPKIIFQANVNPEMFVNDPINSALRYRSPYNLKGERLLDVPPEGQLIFYENSLKIYGEGEKVREINVSRITHELFHQQFDNLDPKTQDEFVDYFSKKYSFDKIKNYLTDKSSQYQDSFDKTKKYENGEKKAGRFIINEFIAHAGGFEEYKPEEPKYLIDLLADSNDVLSQHGFNLEKQKKIEALTKKESKLNEEEKKQKLILEEEQNRAKEAAQAELKQTIDKNPQLMYELKADAAIMGRAFNRFDSDYFKFRAAGFDLDQNDLKFLEQHGFIIANITQKAKTVLDKMEKNSEYLKHQQQKIINK